MNYLIALTIVLFSVSASAQNCTTESLLQKPGVWKESSGGLYGIAAADLVREKKTVAAIHKMIKSKYSPMGVNALSNGGYNSPQSYMPVNSYIYSIIPLNFYCDGGAIKTVHETSTYFQIGVNFFADEIYDTAQGDRSLAEGYNVLSQMPVEKDGYYYFKEKDVTLGFGIPGKSSRWLITYDGKLPYAYVSKKEFLEKRKRNLFIQLRNEATSIKDVLKNIEIGKGFKDAEYKNDAAKMQRYMKMDYQPSKERYEKQLADIETTYKPAFSKIEALLKMPAKELTEPAIVKNDPTDHLSYVFTTENDPFGKILIKPNSGYFDKKFPRSVPQFFSVDIVGDHKDPISAKVIADLITAVDFATLKNMLGK